MSRRQWISLFLGALLVGLIITAPARLLLVLLPSEQVLAHGLSGSLWRGSAAAVMVRTDAGYLHLGRVDWKLSRLSLLLLNIKLQLSSEWGQQRIQGHVKIQGSSSFTLIDTQARIAASLAGRFAPVAVGGVLQAQFEQLLVEEGIPVFAQGRLVWERATFVPPAGPRPLGTYVVILSSPEKGVVEGEVESLAGPLTAEGGFVLSGRAYSVNALLHSESTLDPALKNSLMLFAAPEGDAWRIALDAEI